MRLLLASMCVCMLIGTASAEDKKAESPKMTEEQVKRVEAIKKAIADKKAEIAALENDLAKLLPAKKVKFVDQLWDVDLEEGAVGRFGGVIQRAGQVDYYNAPLRVEKVLDENSMLVTVIKSVPKGGQAPPMATILVKNYSTKGVADGKVISDPPRFIVLGTEKVDGKTLFAVEVYK